MNKKYIDLQINGYAGVDFNNPENALDDIHSVARRLRADGVEKVLATVITAAPERMTACLENLANACSEDSQTHEVIAGIHIEGPFISPEDGYVGAHPRNVVCRADRDFAEKLLTAAGGLVRLITLAPESDPGGLLTRFLAEQGILVAAGHTNASLDDLKACIDQGLTLFTHLGNACPLQMHRHDNIIQRALSFREHLHYGLIADGYHVPPFALRNYIALAGMDRCFIVTDAMSAAGLGPGEYMLGDQTVAVDETQVVWSADRTHFVGSAATMQRCSEVLKQAGFSEENIHRLVYSNPAALLAR